MLGKNFRVAARERAKTADLEPAFLTPSVLKIANSWDFEIFEQGKSCPIFKLRNVVINQR